jgi:hypothetical protein
MTVLLLLLIAHVTAQSITAVSPTLTQTLIAEVVAVATLATSAAYNSFRFRVSLTA